MPIFSLTMKTLRCLDDHEHAPNLEVVIVRNVRKSKFRVESFVENKKMHSKEMKTRHSTKYLSLSLPHENT